MRAGAQRRRRSRRYSPSARDRVAPTQRTARLRFPDEHAHGTEEPRLAGERLGRLKAIHALRVQADEALDHLEREAALAARSAGATWHEIGRAVGLSRSAALRRYRRDEETTP